MPSASSLKWIWVKSYDLKSLYDKLAPTSSAGQVKESLRQWLIENTHRCKSKNYVIYCPTKGQLYIRHWRENLSLPTHALFHSDGKMKALLVRQSPRIRQHVAVIPQPWKPMWLTPWGRVLDTAECGVMRNRKWRIVLSSVTAILWRNRSDLKADLWRFSFIWDFCLAFSL